MSLIIRKKIKQAGVALVLMTFLVPGVAWGQMQQADFDAGGGLPMAAPGIKVVSSTSSTAPTGSSSSTAAAAPKTIKLFNPIKKIPAVDPTTGKKIERDATIPEIIGRGIKVMLGILGSVSLLSFFAGFFFMLISAGKSDLVQKGKNTMLYAGAGLGVIGTAYAVLSLIFERIVI